eukprot:6990-Heterococcus_DN1.PRE.4
MVLSLGLQLRVLLALLMPKYLYVRFTVAVFAGGCGEDWLGQAALASTRLPLSLNTTYHYCFADTTNRLGGLAGHCTSARERNIM